jgi:tripartite motif-containing protein 37
VYSENLFAYGISWRLKVYPNGNGASEGQHISIFLEMVKGI